MIKIKKCVYLFSAVALSFYLIKYSGILFKETGNSDLYISPITYTKSTNERPLNKLDNAKVTATHKKNHWISKLQNTEETSKLKHAEEKTTEGYNSQKHQDFLKSEESYSVLYFGDSDGSLPDSNSRIDNDLISNGLAFTADLSSLANLKPGEMVHVSIPYMGPGVNEVGVVASNQLTPITSSRSVIMEFSNPGTYMTMFYTKGLIKGDIY